MPKKIISTKKAPAAIGSYSQALKVDNIVYVSGQLPLMPETMSVVSGEFSDQLRQIFNNLMAISEEAGGTLDDIVKLNVYLTDLENFSLLNKLMSEYFKEPFPARAVIGVLELPKGVQIEIDATLHL